ncbi:MAG: hypothetical protein U1F67_10660 [Rubrivivax sp.]
MFTRDSHAACTAARARMRSPAAALTLTLALAGGCASTFKAGFTDVRFDESQLPRLEAAAVAAGYTVRQKSATFLSFKTPATIITFSRHERDGTLVASCFDSKDPAKCDDVVRGLIQRAGIAVRQIRFLSE